MNLSPFYFIFSETISKYCSLKLHMYIFSLKLYISVTIASFSLWNYLFFNPPPRSGEEIIGIHFVRPSVCPQHFVSAL